jgi:chemotaxis protein CheC
LISIIYERGVNLKLNEFQKDGIREVMMIGAGHASTAMARTLKKEIDIQTPTVDLLPLEEIPKNLGQLEIVTIGVYTEVKGDIKGRLLTVFSKKDALRLANMIAEKEIKNIENVPNSVLSDLADILAVSNLGAISDFFGMKIYQSPSETAYDMLGALLEQVIVDISQFSDDVLFSKTDIWVSSEKFNCNQIFFLEASSLRSLLEALENI